MLYTQSTAKSHIRVPVKQHVFLPSESFLHYGTFYWLLWHLLLTHRTSQPQVFFQKQLLLNITFLAWMWRASRGNGSFQDSMQKWKNLPGHKIWSPQHHILKFISIQHSQQKHMYPGKGEGKHSTGRWGKNQDIHRHLGKDATKNLAEEAKR